jgi:hypothetical protein
MVSGELALQVTIGPEAAERAPDPPRPLAKRGTDLVERQAGSSKSVCITDTIRSHAFFSAASRRRPAAVMA